MAYRDVHFLIQYDGPVMSTPQGAGLDFGPALQAMAQLVEGTFALLRPGRPKVQVDIQPNRGPGSFIVAVDEVSTPHGLLARWRRKPPDYGKESLTAVMTDLGLIGTHGLIYLVKWLNGRTPAGSSAQADGQVVFELLEDGWPVRKMVTAGAAKLYAEPRMRQLLAQMLEPVTWEGMGLWVVGRGVGLQATVHQGEAGCFTPFLPSA